MHGARGRPYSQPTAPVPAAGAVFVEGAMSRHEGTPDRFDPGVHELWPGISDSALREIVFQSGGAARQSSFAGDIAILGTRPRIAIIGSRRATPDGLAAAEELAAELAGFGAVVVSGAADGIDMAAHLAALAAGGATIACLPFGLGHITCGLGRPRLLAQANSRLLLLSPFPPRQVPSRSTPVVRNRLVASLADAVVAVEFGPASGTLHCVRFARGFGRPVFVVQPQATQDAALQAIHASLRSQGVAFLNPRPRSGRSAATRIIDSARASIRERDAGREAQLSIIPE